MEFGNETPPNMDFDPMVMDLSPESVADDEDEEASELRAPPRASSSRFKGVVPQPNGRWGAQIYEKHARVWLGTFADEGTAARAYDVAALRFRGREAVTNYSASAEGASTGELAFLEVHSKSEIVDMLRKHTYDDELRQGLRRGYGMGARAQPTPSWAREPLFEKTVTPSDVGKLNRLVVPKQHAEKHFPATLAPDTAATGKGVLLNFEDGEGRVWRFRYSYWNSSQSYVLTKGWSRFVREKGLGAGDTVVFYRSAHGTTQDKQLFIDYKKKKDDAAADAVVGETRVVKLFGVDIAGGGREVLDTGAAPVAKERVARVLSRLTENSDNAWAMAAHGGVTALVNVCIDHHISGGKVMCAACRVLRSLVRVDEIRKYMVADAGAVPVLVSLSQRTADEAAQIQAMELLAAITSGNNFARQVVLQEGAVDFLVRVIDPCIPRSSKAWEVALRAIDTICFSSPVSINRLIGARFLNRVLFFLRNDDNTLQHCALKAAHRLCHMSDDETKKAMGDAWFMPELMGILQAAKSLETQEMAAEVLCVDFGQNRSEFDETEQLRY